MSKIKLKNILGSNAHWTINKQLAKDIGLDATCLLQHLIDLQEGFFKKGNFYQEQERLLDDLPLKLKAFRNARKVLEEHGLIEYKRGYQAKYYYTVLTNNVLKFLGIECHPVKEVAEGDSSNSCSSNSLNSYSSNSSNSCSSIPQTLIIKEHKELNKTNIDVPSDDDYYGKIFFRIVDAYPKNRIGNRQHGLKKFKTLSKEDAKLAAINLKRYLNLAGPYVKSLQNYITEECWSEDWLKAAEETKTKKDIKNKNNNFSGDYS